MPKDRPIFRIYDPEEEISKKFDFYIKIVIGVLIVAVITMLLMVGGLMLDAWHFNSAVYREYSEKIQTLDTLQESNGNLLESNLQNQELIMKQQQQIEELLKQK